MSPYLFLLYTEGFSFLIGQAERRGELKGLGVIQGGTKINHLFFADDCVLLDKATKEEWIKMKEVLCIYEKGSGQVLNKEKSSIFL